MIKYYCDRCGQEVDGADLMELTIGKSIRRFMKKEVDMQICQECYREIKEFVRIKKYTYIRTDIYKGDTRKEG